jgi:hypothetical protein
VFGFTQSHPLGFTFGGLAHFQPEYLEVIYSLWGLKDILENEQEIRRQQKFITHSQKTQIQNSQIHQQENTQFHIQDKIVNIWHCDYNLMIVAMALMIFLLIQYF